MRRHSILIALGGCFIVAVGLFLSIGEPAIADLQLKANDQALATAAKHQSTIDAALQQFLTPGPSAGGESDDRLLTQSSANLAQYESSRNLVRTDGAALRNALQPAWLTAAAWSQGASLHAAAQRTNTALAALNQADQVLAAAVDQERLQQGFFYASVTEARMLTAISSRSYVQVDALYARADRGLRVSETLMNKPDQSPGYKPAIRAMRSILDQTQKYAAALLRNDQTQAAALHTAMRAGYASLAAATSVTTVTANNDWNDRKFQPLVAAYHSGLATLLS